MSFQNLDDGTFVYRFHTDQFPGLKGKIDPYVLESTYMKFKVNFFLGPDWTYTTTKHIWKGDTYTEHVISLRANEAARKVAASL